MNNLNFSAVIGSRPAPTQRPSVPTQIHGKYHDHSHSVFFRDGSNVHHKTFGDATIQSRLAGGPKGFGVDLDGDGKFNTQKDGYLKLNLGGQTNSENITRTNDMLKAFSGQTDFDGDGTISTGERIQGIEYSKRASQMDLDGNGTLSRFELQSAGAQVVTYKLGPTDAPVSEQVNLPGFERPQPPYQPPFTQPNMHPFFQSFMKNLFSMFNSFFSPQPYAVAPRPQPQPFPGFHPSMIAGNSGSFG